MAKGDYDGVVVFVDGVHYPVDKNGDAVLDEPLRRNATNDGWRAAEDGETLHNDTHHAYETVVEPDEMRGEAGAEA